MIFSKKQINRAYLEFHENAQNIMDASYENYDSRLRQLFLLIEKNVVLNHLISPYLKMEIKDCSFGIVETRNGRMEYKIPDEEDEEISILLKVLNKIKISEREIIDLTVNLYNHTVLQDNIDDFNRYLVKPGLNKILRKIKYMVDDINDEQNEHIDSEKIKIINYGNINATNSMIGIGKDITQKYSNDIFNQLKEKIESEIIDKNDKDKLHATVISMEEKKDNRISFKEAHDAFLITIGKYMNIFSPLLPYLVDYM